MNFMPAHLEGDRVKLPMAALRADGIGQAADGGSGLIAGIRPEHFEDAGMVADDKRGHGSTFRAHIDLIESMGSELYAHFTVEGGAVESQELAELAQDAGTSEVPGAAEGRIVARLDPASNVAQGQEAELWVDTSRIHFFDAATGGRINTS
jgi:multiple sugar transport system ATP-binding protein